MKRRREKVILTIMLTLLLLVACSNKELANSFDEEIVRDRAEEVIMILNKEDSESLVDMTSPELKLVLTDEVLQEIYRVINEAGDFEDFKDVKIAGDKDKESGEEYAVVVIKAGYEERDFVYTISFNEDMELAGLYYK